MDTVFPLTWTKGLKDNIHYVDIELMRLKEDGLFLVALNGLLLVILCTIFHII